MFFLVASAAVAADCNAMVARAEGLTAETVAAGFAELAACDRKTAEANYLKYLPKAADSEALTALTLAAVDADVWNPVWTSLGKIDSYDARDEVAAAVGAACTDHPKVVKFLQGAYFGLRDVEFQQWDDAFGACSDATLWAWAEGLVKAPPAKQFDEKYNSLVAIYVKQRRVDALPALTEGVIKAAGNNGPFDAMLSQMSEAVVSGMGGQASAEGQQKLVDALTVVAQQVDQERSRAVAGVLANAGAEGAAAKLLPVLYPDRVQAGGGFLYAAATVEAGVCGGKKTAVLHYAPVTEPGKRWTILGDLEGPMRAFKPKLKDCTMESPWPVFHSPEPIKSASEADSQADVWVAEWMQKGYEVKAAKEKAFVLP